MIIIFLQKHICKHNGKRHLLIYICVTYANDKGRGWLMNEKHIEAFAGHTSRLWINHTSSWYTHGITKRKHPSNQVSIGKCFWRKHIHPIIVWYFCHEHICPLISLPWRINRECFGERRPNANNGNLLSWMIAKSDPCKLKRSNIT